MIYVLAFFLPPLALLLNGQIFSAILNAVLFVAFLVIGLLTNLASQVIVRWEGA